MRLELKHSWIRNGLVFGLDVRPRQVTDDVRMLDQSWRRNTVEYQKTGSPTVEWASEISRYALNMDITVDTNDHLVVSSNGIPLGGSKRTVSCWLNAKTGGYHSAIEWGTNSAGTRMSVLRLPNQKIYAAIFGQNISTDATWSDNVWHHVAITFDASIGTDCSGFKIYINGVLEATTLAGSINTVNTSSGDLFIGHQEGVPTTGSQGLTADPCVWDRVLTEPEIRALSDKRFHPFEKRRRSLIVKSPLTSGDPNFRSEYYNKFIAGM